MGLTDLFSADGGDVKNLRDVLLDELKDLYSAENQLLKALPKMEKKASSSKLKLAFRSHLQETQTQVKRLDQIATTLGEKLSGKTCKAMQGLIAEGNEVISEESENPALIDTLLIGAAQRVEHYEIAGYGTARAIANCLGESTVAKLLDATIKEEGAADKKLTEISEKEVLVAAMKRGKNPSKSAQPKVKASAKGKAAKGMARGSGASSRGKKGRGEARM